MTTTIAVCITFLLATLLALKTSKRGALWVYTLACLFLLPFLAYTIEGLNMVLSTMTVGQVTSDFFYSAKGIFTAPFSYGTERFNPALAFLGSTTILASVAASVSLSKTLVDTYKREKATNERYE